MINILFLIGFFLIFINLFKHPNLVFLLWSILYTASILGTSYGLSIELTIGPFHIFPNDAISFLFLLVIVKRSKIILFKIKNFPLLKLLSLVLGLNVIVFFIELLFRNESLQSLYNLSRGFIEIPFFFLYYISFQYHDQRFKQYSKLLNILSLMICIFFWIMTSIIFSGKLNMIHDDRAVSAFISFFTCIASIFLFVKYVSHKTNRGEVILLFLFIITIIFMRDRSIWLGFIGGILTILYNYKAQISKTFSVIFLTISLIFGLQISFPSIGSRIIDKFLKSSQVLTDKESFENSTGAFRMARWESRIKNNFDARVLFFGQGHGYERSSFINFNGRKSKNSTSFHNQYLEQAFRIGLISVILLLVVLIRLFRINKRHLSKDIAISFNAAYACTLIYGMAYNFQLIFYIIVAINISILYRSYFSNSNTKNKMIENRNLRFSS